MGMKPRGTPFFVEREFWLVTQSRERRIVSLRIEKPLRYARSEDGYYCHYAIEGLQRNEVIERGAAGEDGAQALYHAMQIAMTSLVTSRAYQEGRLSWLGSPDLGLPVMEAIREMVQPAIWVRMSKVEESQPVPVSLNLALRAHLPGVEDREVKEIVEQLIGDGHVFLPFTVKVVATEFSKDVRSLGLRCDFDSPDWGLC